MKKERPYEFRKSMNNVHQPDRRDYSIKAGKNEISIGNGWEILIDKNASEVIIKVAKDLQDYFFTSMGVSLLLKKDKNISENSKRKNTIIIGIEKNFRNHAKKLSGPRCYSVKVTANTVVICGYDDRSAAQGSYYLEDIMNLKEAPVLEKGTVIRKSLFSPRMTHSGWGLDLYPDAHLSAIAHGGIDAILIFVKDVDTTTVGYLDFNDLVDRAASFGIDVYFYSYLKSLKHPKEKDAKEFYQNGYGRLFKSCPGAKGVILVGESCEFPSKDTVNTTGKFWDEPDDGIRPVKPSPGWWPCCDYPEWLEMIKETVKRNSPDAEIVFWTYNWGFAPEKDRIALINSLPDDITLQVTFEMFEPLNAGKSVKQVTDYTIAYVGPGKYFASEAKAARKKNIRLYAMTNTAGRTWDFGTAPYVPVPQQWGKRHKALRDAHKNWGLCGLMESHHYGYHPSVISELAKWNFWDPMCPQQELLKKIARRDFGEKGVNFVLKAWEHWSDAITKIPVSAEDKYGPLRAGPTYPFIFHPDLTRTFLPQDTDIPHKPFAHFGSEIVKTFYHPYENINQSPGAVRLPFEKKLLEEALREWNKGIASLEKAVSIAPNAKKAKGRRMVGLGKFIAAHLVTTLNVKKWWELNHKLVGEPNPKTALKLLDKIENLLKEEIKNTKDTIPVVEADSRLGWEPSMEYMTDREHLEWKIRHAMRVLNHEIPDYRKILKL